MNRYLLGTAGTWLGQGFPDHGIDVTHQPAGPAGPRATIGPGRSCSRLRSTDSAPSPSRLPISRLARTIRTTRTAESILALQRSAGNWAVGQSLQRREQVLEESVGADWASQLTADQLRGE